MSEKKEKKSIINYLIILLIILLLLIIGFTSFDYFKTNKTNSKNLENLEKISNLLKEYKSKNNTLPSVSGNKNYFLNSWDYAHKNEKNIFWVYNFLIWDFSNKKEIFIDSKTNSYFSYWKKNNNSEFQIAWIVEKNWDKKTKIIWNYNSKYWPISLIREYNWPIFISENSSNHFPYNPEEKFLTAQISKLEWSIKINWKKVISINNFKLKALDKIELEKNNFAEIYTEDWTFFRIWSIKQKTILDLKEYLYKQEDKLKTNIKLFLTSWKIFIKAASQSENSEFEILTQDATAAVRWTIYQVEKNSKYTKITLNIWEVDVENNSWKLLKNMKVLSYKNPQTLFVTSWKIINQENENSKENSEEIIENINKNWEKKYDSKIENNNSNSNTKSIKILNSKNTWESFEEKNKRKFEELEKKLNKNNYNYPEILKETKKDLINRFYDFSLDIDYPLLAFSPFDYDSDLKLYVQNGDYIKEKQNWVLWNDCLPNTKKIVADWFENNDCVNKKVLAKKSYDLNVSSDEQKKLKLSKTRIQYKEYRNNFYIYYWYDLVNSFFKWVNIWWAKWESWIILDNLKTHPTWDFLYYNLEKLDLNWDFVLEINAKIPNDNTIHYLFNYWENFRIFVKNNKVIFNSELFFPWVSLTPNKFNKIFVIKKDNKIYLKVWEQNSVFTKQFFKQNLDKIYIWSYKVWNNYFKQFNNIIDYFKIYKN